MKTRYIFLIQCYLFSMSVFSQSSNMNYIVKYQPQTALTMQNSYTPQQAITEVTYFDGIGRPMETVQKGITPPGGDLVTMTEYDEKGRVGKEWIPVAIPSNNGNFISAGTMATYAEANYQDSYAYSEYTYEDSDIGRVVNKVGPGQFWKERKRMFRNSYLINNITDAKLRVNKYLVDNGKLKKEGYYPKGELSVSQISDENMAYTLQFTDKNGRVVLFRKLGDNNVNHDTYYVYDNKGNKCFVLSPMASDVLNEDRTYLASENSLSLYSYFYLYDSQNRCVSKRLPGASPVYYVYDKLGRVVLCQDGNQRSKQEWSFIKYDGLSRPVLNGVVTLPNKVRGQLEVDYADVVSKEEQVGTFSSLNCGYTNNTQPTSGLTIHLATYYDNYSFVPTFSILSYSGGRCDPAELNAKGLMTGQCSSLLDGSGKRLTSAFYYDKKGRVVQQRSGTLLTNGFDVTNMRYNFVGNPVYTHINHMNNGDEYTEYYTYTYDQGGRLKKTIHSLTEDSERVISERSYNDLCQLSSDKMGSLPSVTYTYNIRSWLNTIGSIWYEQMNYYEKNQLGQYSQYYSGSLSSAVHTIHPNGSFGNSDYIKKIDYRYDKLNRLLSAYNQYDSSAGEDYFDEEFGYDKNGNISRIVRLYKNSVEDAIDFSYNGNQLIRVLDEWSYSPYMDELTQFTTMADPNALAYFYDSNGNLIKDLHRNISNVVYNPLNLPNQVQFGNGSFINYSYTSIGEKCKVKYRTMENPVVIPAGNQFAASQTSLVSREDSTEYCGNFIYENGQWVKVLIPNGYITKNKSSQLVYHYYIKDHLGSNRVVVDENGNMVQAVEYYPSGIPVSKNDLKDNHLHTGKEFEGMHGLHWYDNNKRMYDPILCRFTTMDPLCEKYYDTSPYVHCGNNPVNNIDLNGMEWKTIEDEDIAKQMQLIIVNRDKSLAKQETKINAKIENIGNNSQWSDEKKNNKIAKLQGKLENIREQRSILSESSIGITQLGDSKTTYTFNTVETGVTAILSSQTDGTVIINNYGTTGNRLHETTHAIQYNNGSMSFKSLGTNEVIFKDHPIGLELKAYRAEYAVSKRIPYSENGSPRSIFEINLNWINGLKNPLTGTYPYRLENYK